MPPLVIPASYEYIVDAAHLACWLAPSMKDISVVVGGKTVPVQEIPKRKIKLGSAKGIITRISDDFDAPLDAFADYR